MNVILPYAPRPLQRKVHEERARFAVLLTHRRFGKTVLAVNDLIRAAVRGGRPNWRAGYLCPWLRQAKTVAWDYLREYAGPIPGAVFHETELRCDLPGGRRIRLFGADNAQGLRGQYLDDLVVDESADISRGLWETVLRPLLADRRGRALFLGTPNGTENLLYHQWQRAISGQAGAEWTAFRFRASETGYVAPAELEAARADMSEEAYAQEFECSFTAAVRGALYRQELERAEREGRLASVPHEPGLLVHTAWDLGMDDATAVWFIQLEPASGQWRVIDYYEASGEGLPHYASMLAAKGYAYGRHIAPHDIRVRELGTGRSRLETARGLGLRFDVCPNLPLADGLAAVRLGLGRMWFDAGRCAEGLRALGNYRREWRPREETFEARPLHNWASHAADALRYACLGLRPPGGAARQSTARKYKM